MMITILEKINALPYRQVIWALAVTETIHNIEEAVWLPAWSQSAGKWHQSVGAFEFRFAVVAITFLCYGIIYYFNRSQNKFSRYVMGGALVMILFNVFIPHVIAAIVMQKYAPGIISGVLLNIPITLYLMMRGIKEKIFKTGMLIFGALGFSILLVPLLQFLFIIGRYTGYVF